MLPEAQIRSLVRAGMKYHNYVLYDVIYRNYSGGVVITLVFGNKTVPIDYAKNIVHILGNGEMEKF